MKKHKKRIIIGGIVLLFVVIIAIITINILRDKNSLTSAERRWISNQSGTVQNIKVVNDINVFGKEGIGVFFEFLNDFERNYNLKINPISYSKENTEKGLAFKVSTKMSSNDLLIYQDHFVLVGKNEENLRTSADLASKKIGVLSKNLSYVSSYLSNINNISFTQYESEELLLDALREGEEISYILVPLNEYMHHILSLDYHIVYHLGDIPVYYTLQLSDDEKTLSSIMKKYYNTWIDTRFDRNYNKANLNMFIDALGIVEKDKDTLTSRVYNYGFVQNSPYEVIMGGNYGGIISSYLKKFSDFSNVEFKFIKYKKISNLYSAVNKKNVDVYFNTTDMTSDYKTVPSLLNINFSVIARTSNYITVNSLRSLSGKNVYVLEKSVLATYLQTQDYLNIKTYKSIKDIPKIKDKNAVIVIDTNIFNYYGQNTLKQYTSRYSETLNRTYNFNTNVNETFNKIFAKYINSLDPKEMINIGVNNHAVTIKNGTVIGRLASYTLYLFVGLIIVGYFVYRSSKRIKLATKIKKEDKMRFIDQLTSLKNRNYLSENIDAWNNNTIYPQATIVMDLNNVQEINDTLGYDQGDAQIKAAANILIKTQLDNSDIIRTDGNEFLIYLVGYEEKQIVSYIRKIYKELKNMPFDYGAALGYSMILDDLKTIEDAVNEAVEDMRIKKSESYEE